MATNYTRNANRIGSFTKDDETGELLGTSLMVFKSINKAKRYNRLSLNGSARIGDFPKGQQWDAVKEGA